jgi:hypothetical protein
VACCDLTHVPILKMLGQKMQVVPVTDEGVGVKSLRGFVLEKAHDGLGDRQARRSVVHLKTSFFSEAPGTKDRQAMLFALAWRSQIGLR